MHHDPHLHHPLQFGWKVELNYSIVKIYTCLSFNEFAEMTTEK